MVAGGKPIHIGCSGWNYRDWKEWPYEGKPPSQWLQIYSRLFGTVEVNSTFYRLASPKAVAAWVEQSPEHFIFAVKSSRYLTHIKRLTELDQGIKRYYESIEPLARSPKMGPVLWQLPENFKRDDERLANALAALPEGRHCFEFRSADWFTEEIYELLRRHNVALVIGDMPKRSFQTFELTTDWTFIRFHYGHRGRNGNYSDTELQEWADRIRGFSRKVEVFAYFNNDWNAYAVRNGLRMRKLLGV